MTINTDEPGLLSPVRGISLNALSAGICRKKRPDLALIKCNSGSAVSAVFTRNAFCAAPVVISKKHLDKHTPVYLLINAGNANAGNGKKGIDDALCCARSIAEYTGCSIEEVLLFSTGVIGERLPCKKIKDALPELIGSLAENKWGIVSQSLLTTDTRTKGISRKIMINNKEVNITGIAKGSGMIKPDMATMLAFIATDASISKPLLDRILRNSIHRSFNRITIDGDTSTNDACVLIATGASGMDVIADTDSAAYGILYDEIVTVCTYLAQEIVRDGEGATKFITLEVSGGRTEEEAVLVAESVAHSPLVKTALFASDPNWGRILAAVGRSGLEDLDIGNVDIHVGNLCIVRNGEKSANYTEAKGAKVFRNREIVIRVELNRGECSTRIWTCDLSYDYVRINAEYRT